MYTQFYGFKFKPFDLLPDPRFLYLSKKHDLALTHLEYGITDNKAFVVLTGDVGTGKTTLINFLLRKIKADVNTALIFNTNLDPTTFLEMVVKDFGLKTDGLRRSALYDSLYQFLLHEHIHGRRSVLIIDEAQNMPTETLEEVRMLSNFETEESYLLQIVMAGQPQLRRRLNDPELAQLTQRVSVYYHLAPLEQKEIGRYIGHRLKVTGYTSPDPLFTSKAIETIYKHTNGVPRLISSICDTALVYGYADEIKTIDSDLIERVIKNRGIDPGIRSDGDGIIRHKKADSGKTKTTDTPERIKRDVYSAIAGLHERVTSIEQRLSQLRSVENEQSVANLIEWLKKAQEENRKLQEHYNALLSHSKEQRAPTPVKDARETKKKRWWEWFGVTFSLLAMIFFLYGCVSKDEKRDYFLQTGIKLYEAGHYKKAILEFKNALQLDPNFAVAHLYAGRVYFKEGSVEKARNSISKAIELEQTLDDARLDLGMMLVMSKRGEKALEIIGPLLEENPSHVSALLIKAQAYLALKNPDNAIECLDKIVQAKVNKDVLLAFAHAYDLRGERERVKEYFSAYQRAAPDDPESYLTLSRIYAKEKQLEKAERQITKLIGQKKGDVSYPLLLAKFFVDTGQDKKAGSEFKRLVKESPQEARYKLAYADFLIQRNRLNESHAVLAAAVNNAPDSWEVRDYMVKVCLVQGKVDNALEELDDFLQRNPKQGKVETLLKKGHIMAQLDRWEEALQQCDLALAIEPFSADSHLLKGKVLFQKGRFDDAIIHLRQVVDARPSETEGRIFLARALAFSGKICLGIDELKRGLKVVPQEIAFLMELISFYQKEDDWGNALEYANTALNKAPQNPQILDTVAWVEFKCGNLDKAIRYANSAAKRAAEEPIINYHAGLINAERGKNKAARRYLSKAMELGLQEEYAKECERLLKTLQ